ncbi:MAG: hypothetical protein EA382_18130 [Spirochaetaceae bacterium]|nr:MAG: hypothetical protein EA382_18130 [Spirochaetaceae bacterium]
MLSSQATFAQAQDDAQAAQRFYAAGQAAMEDGDRVRAVAAWRLAVRHDPTHLQGWIALGDALFDTDPAFAATAYRRALDILTDAAPTAAAPAAEPDTASATAPAEPPPGPLAPGEEIEGVLNTVAEHLHEELGRAVHLSPIVARRFGTHAFVIATIRRPDGRRLDWENTPYADMSAADMMSETSMTLLEQQDGSWRVKEHETGPTDVAWLGWMHFHGLPQALFGEDE